MTRFPFQRTEAQLLFCLTLTLYSVTASGLPCLLVGCTWLGAAGPIANHLTPPPARRCAQGSNEANWRRHGEVISPGSLFPTAPLWPRRVLYCSRGVSSIVAERCVVRNHYHARSPPSQTECRLLAGRGRHQTICLSAGNVRPRAIYTRHLASFDSRLGRLRSVRRIMSAPVKPTRLRLYVQANMCRVGLTGSPDAGLSQSTASDAARRGSIWGSSVKAPDWTVRLPTLPASAALLTLTSASINANLGRCVAPDSPARFGAPLGPARVVNRAAAWCRRCVVTGDAGLLLETIGLTVDIGVGWLVALVVIIAYFQRTHCQS